jgi:mRNA-degrading endonuclease RelE of RelBE toxin-antitoxin system
MDAKWTVVITNKQAQAEFNQLVQGDIRAQIKTILREMANMANPMQHAAVCPIKCTNGGLFRVKEGRIRIVIKLYAICDETVIDIWHGDTLPASNEKFIDIIKVLERDSQTYKAINQIWQTMN